MSGDGSGVGGELFGELVGERREEPAGALPGLVEVAGLEVAGGEQLQDVAFDVRADGFKEVEGEAVTVLLVSVDDAETGVEADGEGGEPAFDFGQGVAVVEQRVAVSRE